MALVGNVLLGTGAAPAVSSIASAYAESAASSRIPWNALEYSGETITAISGSAIGGQGGTDSATVSAIASAYAESAASGKLDNSASSTFQPSGDYAYASSLSSYLPGSASSQFAPSGDYAFNSSLSSKLDESAFTAYTATPHGHTYTGVSPISVDNENNLISLSAIKVDIDYSLKAYMSGGSALIGMTYPIQVVSASSMATGNNIIYVVTGSN